MALVSAIGSLFREENVDVLFFEQREGERERYQVLDECVSAFR